MSTDAKNVENSEIKMECEDESMSVETTDTKDTDVNSEVDSGKDPAASMLAVEPPSSGLKMVIRLESSRQKKVHAKASRVKSASGKQSQERTHEEIQKEPLRNDGYCTSALSALDPAVYALLSGIVSQKITRDRPHFCMFCGHQFVSGSGVYIHYYRHKVKNDLSQSCRRRAKETKADSRKNAPEDVPATASSKKKPSTAAKSGKAIVNGKSQTTCKPVTSKMAAVAATEQPTTSTTPAAVATTVKAGYVKPFPTRLLPAKTLKMLRDLLKQKITLENPHFCKFCQHPFFSGCGIYIHYLKHVKKSAKKQVKADSNSLASAKQRIRKKVFERCSKSGAMTTAASPKKTLPASSVNNAAVLDTKTLLMLRDIATRISPEDPHVCEICEHPFYNARGIQAHYLKHAKQNLSNGKPISSDAVAACSKSPAAATKLKELGGKRKKSDGDKKPSPLQWLRPTVLNMLQGVVREGISDSKPHKCKFCPKVFVRGTGLYFHYLQHKGATKVFTGMNASAKAVPMNRAPTAVVGAAVPPPKNGPAKSKASIKKPSAKKLVKKKSLPSTATLQANMKLPPRPPPPRMPTHAAKSLSHPMNNRSVPTAQPIVNSLDTAAKVAVLSGGGGGGGGRGRKRDTAFVLCQLEHNTKKLLYHLTKDVEVLQSFGWPQEDASSIVDEILGACNVTPMRRSSQYPSRKLECLRSNVLKLIKFCIRDEVMVAKGWKNKLVDDAVKEIIATEGNFSGELLK